MVKVLQNNVRLWNNNGLTNKELKERGYSVITNMEQGEESPKTKKLGRNNPCHCGSGKK